MISLHGVIVFGYIVSEDEYFDAMRKCNNNCDNLPDNWMDYFIISENNDYFLGVKCAVVSADTTSIPLAQITCPSPQGTVLMQLFTEYIEPYTDNIYLPQFWLTCLWL